MTSQPPLFVESYHDALYAVALALGGFKKVGVALRPELAADVAGRWLADCCNPQVDRELHPLQLMHLRRMARDAGVHTLAAFEMQDAGYAEPQPVDPEDVQAELMREFIRSVEDQKRICTRIEATAKRKR